MKRQYRQGDILLDEAVLRPQFSLAETQGTDIVLAVGERTGHAHRIQCAAALLSKFGGKRYLWLEEDARLVHEEHNPILIPKGVYRVIQQQQYTEASKPEPEATKSSPVTDVQSNDQYAYWEQYMD